MSWVFIAALIAAALTVILTILWIVSRRNGGFGDLNERVPGVVPVVGLVLTLVFIVMSSFTIVGTRDIGVVTSFGRPVAHLDNGLHAKAPWEEMATLDGAIQTDNYVGQEKDDAENCTDIRIGNESTACIDNSIRWRIKPNAGDTLFQDYHTMDNIRDSLVTRELKASLNEALANYNPLDEIENNGTGAKPNLSAFSSEVTTRLRSQIGDQIDVLNVIIPLIRFDPSTQAKINSYQAEVANTRIAQQREQTASAQARANQALTKSVSNQPNVLVAQCFNTLDEMVKQKMTPPAGFSCWPGGSSAVVVPSGK